MSEKEEPKEEKIVLPPILTANQAPVTGNKWSSYISLVIMIICVVLAAGSLFIYLMKNEKPESHQHGNNSSAVVGNLIDGKEYLLYLRSVEVQPQKPNGKPWDLSNNAPDVFYRVFWQKNQIYQSETMKDSLIADWIPVGLSLKDSILSGQVSVDQAVKIPKVRFNRTASNSDEVVIHILDDDTLSGNDPIEQLHLWLSKMHLGDNVLDFRDKNDHGLIKAVVRVIDNSLSTDEKIQALMRGP